MSGWRVWFAFESKPGIRKASQRDLSAHYRGLRELCRGPTGKVDVDEYMRWLDIIVDFNEWGEA